MNATDRVQCVQLDQRVVVQDCAGALFLVRDPTLIGRAVDDDVRPSLLYGAKRLLSIAQVDAFSSAAGQRIRAKLW